MIDRWSTMDGLVGGGIFPLPQSPTSPSSTPDPQERFLSDVWVYVTLALMAVSCVGCVCSCLLYHKIQQWKHHDKDRDDDPDIPDVELFADYLFPGGGPFLVGDGIGDIGSSFGSDIENQRDEDEDSLPSYTLVTGLPTYEQAIEQLKEAKKLTTLTVTGLLEAYSPPLKS